MCQEVGASITIFQPDVDRLRENIAAILPQVEYLFLIVNGRESIQLIDNEIKHNEKIRIRVNDCNLGVAHALNQALSLGKKLHMKWVLTLDQDTVVTHDLVERLMTHASVPKVGIICPGVKERSDPNRRADDFHGWRYVLSAITSGSLTNVEIWEKIGGFDDRLFIDCVDHDYCARLIQAGFGIIRDDDAIILHEIGKQELRYCLGMGPFPVLNHSAMRRYYLFRNINYFCYKYPTLCRTAIDRKRFLAGTVLTVALYEDKKTEKLSAMLRGWIDYKKLIRHEKKEKKKNEFLEMDFSPKQ